MATAIAVGAVGFLAWFLLSPAGPSQYRHKTLDRVRKDAEGLAMMTAGASVTVRQEASRRSFSFVKQRDSGQIEQSIAFVLSESEWSTQIFETARGRLEEALFIERYQVEGDPPNRVLSCAMTATPRSMGYLVDQLIAVLSPVLGLDQGDWFTLRVEGATDMAIWRRANVKMFREMSDEDEPWITRQLGRWHLRKHDRERPK